MCPYLCFLLHIETILVIKILTWAKVNVDESTMIKCVNVGISRNSNQEFLFVFYEFIDEHKAVCYS